MTTFVLLLLNFNSKFKNWGATCHVEDKIDVEEDDRSMVK